jgi:urocanate hydratase
MRALFRITTKMEEAMDVHVNAGEWKGLSAEDRAKIQSIIQASFKEMKISSTEKHPMAMEALANRKVAAFNFGKPFCTAACGVAEAAAVAACAALSGPAVAICVAAAHAAGDLCRKQC